MGNDEGAHLLIAICPPVTTDLRGTYPNNGAAMSKAMIPIESFITAAPGFLFSVVPMGLGRQSGVW
jgi:hypothetical protein